MNFLLGMFSPKAVPMNVDLLVQSVSRGEGRKPYVYDDATGQPIVKGYTVQGNPTIGIGRLVTKDKGLSNDEINTLLRNDLTYFYALAQKEPWWPAVSDNDARSRAMVELIFNMGLGHFRLFTDTINCLIKKDFKGASLALLDSKWATQVGDRAHILASQIETGSG